MTRLTRNAIGLTIFEHRSLMRGVAANKVAALVTIRAGEYFR